MWRHLREPELVRRWFRWEDAELDERIRDDVVDAPDEHERTGDGTTTRTLTWPRSVLVVEARATTGSAAGVPATEAAATGAATAGRRAPGGGRTRLSVTRPSREGSHAAYDGVRDELDELWIASAQQLRFALGVQPGEERRTLAVIGLDAGTSRDRLLARAGLHGVRGVPVGGNVQARRPDGTLLGGTVWFKTDQQLGLHLHGITAALLVLQETPVASDPPNGAVNAVLNAYGVDDATFADVGARWSAWWSMAARGERVI
ncbi:hypothetical protein [Cellulomonas sp. HZM]|uniref:hypothetical protein n=1 Tax=Cellulomonas sp. HZM TaxID=1454010 RepID=UPI0006915365|nr:hypothetical protein [Cellulomonas sp. HZM]